MMMAKTPAQGPGLMSRPWVWKTILALAIFVLGVSVGMSHSRGEAAQCESLGPAPAASVQVTP